jgi:hypothetical protein
MVGVEGESVREGDQGQPIALRKLSDADRAYRPAPRWLTSRGGLERSTRTSFVELVAATERLQSAAQHVLRGRDDTTSYGYNRTDSCSNAGTGVNRWRRIQARLWPGAVWIKASLTLHDSSVTVFGVP